MNEHTNEYAINTRDVYYQLRNKYNDFPVKLLIEFRERLEEVLIKHERVTSEFHPSNWRYFRNKYLQWYDEKWQKTEEESKHKIFSPTYFMYDNVNKKRISLDSLTDDEKIQIVAPLRENTSVQEQRPSIEITRISDKGIRKILSPLQNPKLITTQRNNTFELVKILKFHKTLIFEDLSQTERQEILGKICPISTPISSDAFSGLMGMFEGNRGTTNRYNNNDPYDWWRWEYDIYTLDMSYEVQIDIDDEDFEFFFTWQLALTDLFQIKKFLQLHLKHTFKNKLSDFRDFIEILYIKYDRILFEENNQKVVFKYLDKIEVEEEEVETIEKLDNDLATNNLATITINLPNFSRTKYRKSDDGLTCLSRERTALLIDILREVNVFLKEDIQPNANVAKAIQVLTGFSFNKLRTDLTNIPEKEDLLATRQILEKSIKLIDKHLRHR